MKTIEKFIANSDYLELVHPVTIHNHHNGEFLEDAYEILSEEFGDEFICLWDDSPETVWCDIFDMPDGKKMAIGSDTELQCGSTFFCVILNS